MWLKARGLIEAVKEERVTGKVSHSGTRLAQAHLAEVACKNGAEVVARLQQPMVIGPAIEETPWRSAALPPNDHQCHPPQV